MALSVWTTCWWYVRHGDGVPPCAVQYTTGTRCDQPTRGVVCAQTSHGFPVLVNHGLCDVGHDINRDVMGMGHVLYEVRHSGRGCCCGWHR